jgi:hypothetical protein
MPYRKIEPDFFAAFEAVSWVIGDYYGGVLAKPSIKALENVLGLANSRQSIIRDYASSGKSLSPAITRARNAQGFHATEKRRMGLIMSRYQEISDIANGFLDPSLHEWRPDAPGSPQCVRNLYSMLPFSGEGNLQSLAYFFAKYYTDVRMDALKEAAGTIKSELDMLGFAAYAEYAKELEGMRPEHVMPMGNSELIGEIGFTAVQRLRNTGKNPLINAYDARVRSRRHHTVKQAIRALSYLGDEAESRTLSAYAIDPEHMYIAEGTNLFNECRKIVNAK